jgi:hypothetical protein
MRCPALGHLRLLTLEHRRTLIAVAAVLADVAVHVLSVIMRYLSVIVLVLFQREIHQVFLDLLLLQQQHPIVHEIIINMTKTVQTVHRTVVDRHRVITTSTTTVILLSVLLVEVQEELGHVLVEARLFAEVVVRGLLLLLRLDWSVAVVLVREHHVAEVVLQLRRVQQVPEVVGAEERVYGRGTRFGALLQRLELVEAERRRPVLRRVYVGEGVGQDRRRRLGGAVGLFVAALRHYLLERVVREEASVVVQDRQLVQTLALLHHLRVLFGAFPLRFCRRLPRTLPRLLIFLLLRRFALPLRLLFALRFLLFTLLLRVQLGPVLLVRRPVRSGRRIFALRRRFRLFRCRRGVVVVVTVVASVVVVVVVLLLLLCVILLVLLLLLLLLWRSASCNFFSYSWCLPACICSLVKLASGSPSNKERHY